MAEPPLLEPPKQSEKYQTRMLDAAKIVIDGERMVSREVLCDEYKISSGDLSTAIAVLREGTHDMIRAIEQEGLSVWTIHKILKHPVRERHQLLEKTIAAKNAGIHHALAAARGRKPHNYSVPRRFSATDKMEACLDQIEIATEALKGFAKESQGKKAELKNWEKRMRKARAALTVSIYQVKHRR